MLVIYSLILTVAFVLMLPLFILRREKYASGFGQRLGSYPEFRHDGRPVIWLHCVSVGETNAARPLVDQLIESFPRRRLIISTTTKTGQELAKNIFAEKADAVFYFPFDWKFSVRRALANFRPSVIILMETEIWPRFIDEAKRSGAVVAIVNGRLSEKSFESYSRIKPFVRKVLSNLTLALMQDSKDAERIISLGMAPEKVLVTGNLKFDLYLDETESKITREIRDQFAVSGDRPLIVAASTHEPEEKWVLSAFLSVLNDFPESCPRLLLVPRHPERFKAVSELVEAFRYSPDCEWRDYKFVQRSESQREKDKTADVILLDSVGELRAVYPLAEIVFVGGSLIPHGGQSVLEPAAAGKAIVTGPHTHNFDAIVQEFLAHDALIQLPEAPQEFQVVERLRETFTELIVEEDKRRILGERAATVMTANRGATGKTIKALNALIERKD